VDDLSDRLTNAEQRVLAARRIVARHCEFVANEIAKGHPIQDATGALELFLGTLRTFEEHERFLRGVVRQVAHRGAVCRSALPSPGVEEGQRRLEAPITPQEERRRPSRNNGGQNGTPARVGSFGVL
jgi:hypothetical protein